jgi:hypothetical protein
MIRRNLPLPTCPGWTPQWFGPYFAITIAVRVSARLIGRFIVAELQAQIHPRMPVILPEKHHAAWAWRSGKREIKSRPGPLSCRGDANVGE